MGVSLSNAQINNTDNQEDWASMERELLEQNIAKGFIYGSKKTLALQQQHDNRVVCAIGGKIYNIELYTWVVLFRERERQLLNNVRNED